LSSTRTVRFDRELDKKLQEVANHSRMSVNAIVNRSVRQFLEWDRHAERFGIMQVSPTLLATLMIRVPLDEARDLGRVLAKDVVRPSIEDMFPDFTFENAMEFFRRFAVYTGRFQFEDRSEGRKHVIVIRHPLGSKWSAYYEGMLEGILHGELRIKVEQVVGPETVVMKFDLPEASGPSQH
jgi:hypothetical protein